MDQPQLTCRSSVAHDFKLVENAAFEFTAMLEQTDRDLRKAGVTVPPLETRKEVAAEYWRVFSVVEVFQAKHPLENLSPFKVRLRAILSPWLSRSRFFWRSYAKPHGYAGDFKIIDWMYDLESCRGEDPTEPAMVNCLDYTFSTNHSVVSLWDRRRWLTELLLNEAKRKPDLKVLDIACGGARYLRDFLEQCDSAKQVSLTLMDQDPAALAFAEQRNLKEFPDNVSTICAPIKHIHKVITDDYDVIISSGLFDYLDQQTSSSMLAFFASKLTTKGIVAITNYHKNDASALSKDWCADWPLIFKDEQELLSVFPANAQANIELSPNGSLMMATWRNP